MRSRGRKRVWQWEQIPSNFTLITATASAFINISHSKIINGETSGGTVRRLIGELAVEHDLGAQALELTNFAVGITVVTTDALAAFALPDPLSTVDEDHPWYFWDSRQQTLGPAGTDHGLIRIPIDIKSSRHLRGDYRLAFCMSKGITELGLKAHLSLRLGWNLDA